MNLKLLGGMAAFLTGVISVGALAADQPSMPMTNSTPMPGPAASTDGGMGGAMPMVMGTPYDVPASLAPPSVTITVTPDSKSGWNLHIMVKNFTFAGGHAGGANVPGEGHGHILVDGKMVGRAYGEWVYLSTAEVPAGAQMLTVRLETDDHRDYLVGGQLVEASAQLMRM